MPPKRKLVTEEEDLQSSPTRTFEVVSRSDSMVIDEDDNVNNKDPSGLTASHDEGYFTHAENVETPKALSNDGQSPRAAANGFDNEAMQAILSRATELLQAISKLEALGIENLNISLPKIVVVGDQSAGKSSLLEAISDVKVLKKSGTCTRCPLRISLIPAENDRWTCNVTLQKYFDLYRTDDGSEESKYGPWKLKEFPDIKQFAEIYQKDELENVLKRAQCAILNPGSPPSNFASSRNLPKKNQEDFSPNVIALEIKGSNLPQLSFYDLPGVIAASEDPTQTYLIQLIEQLARDYVAGEDNIVLLACSMESDRATSTASQIVQRARANKRCVGVLTKADRFPPDGDMDTWKAILHNKKFPVGHGYFVTRQPSQSELDSGITHEQARAKETSFFDAAPWNTTLSQFQDKFGSLSLQNKLSQLLVSEILRTLPRIRTQIEEKMSSVEAELLRIPEPPAEVEAFNTVMMTVTNFSRVLEKEMDGDRATNDSLMLRWKGLRKEYYAAMMSMKPKVVPSGKDDELQRQKYCAQFAIFVDSDDEGTPSPSTGRRQMAPPSTPAVKRQRLNTTPNLPRSQENARKFTLDGVRQTLHDLSTSGLPGNIDPRAEDDLILQSITDWHQPFDQFFRQSKKMLWDKILEILHEVLEKWENTLLAQEVLEAVKGHFDSVVVDAHDKARDVLEAELKKPMTMNEEWLQITREKELQTIRDAREELRTKKILDDMKSPIKNRAATMKNILSSLGPEPYTKEIEVMSTIRAYYIVAAGTFVDTVCKLISRNLFDRCKEELATRVQAYLKLHEAGTPARCQRLLAEDSEREERRTRLKKEREKLVEAKSWLDGLPSL